jgi:putative FmdB family regulatory protein
MAAWSTVSGRIAPAVVNFFVDRQIEVSDLPLYEYKCRKCGKHTEKIEKFTGRHLTKCPSCGGRVDRLPSAPAIQFKGSGWYVTDYGRPSASADNAMKQDGAPAAEKSDAKTGDKNKKETKEAPPKQNKNAAVKEK